MDERTCVVCDEPYERTAGRGTCSTRCLMWAIKHPGDKPDKVRDCLLCGTTFEVVHRAMRYCGARCRAAASKRRTGRAKKPFVRHVNCFKCNGLMPEGVKAGAKYCSPECGSRDRRNEAARVAALEDRRCTHCGIEFHPRNYRNVTCSRRCSRLVHYYANKAAYTARTLQWMADHPERTLTLARSWREKNADKIRESNRAWTRANADRVAVIGQARRSAKKNNRDSVGVSLADWQSLVRRANGCCYYCGSIASPVHMEHVVPLSRGGRHAIGNVVPSCPRCNLTKHDMFVMEWRVRDAKIQEQGGDAQWSQAARSLRKTPRTLSA